MGSAAKESGLCWVFKELGTLAAMAAGGNPGLGEGTEEEVCPWWHCLDGVPLNHLTFGPHGLSTVTQKAVSPIIFWVKNMELPAFPRGQEFRASGAPSSCPFPVGYLPEEVMSSPLGESALLMDI